MATRIVLLSGQETTVTQTKDRVVDTVRRDHANPVKLAGVDGVVQGVITAHITSVGPGPSPVP